MAKTKPVRLSQGFMETVTSAAKSANRTPAEQVEHWASLGRKVDKAITLDDMLDVLCGIAKLKVERVTM